MFRKKHTPPLREVRPYQMLAHIYDFVMRHVDYEGWAEYVERLFAHHGPVPRRIIEVACGTGTLAMKLSARGYLVRGIDASPEMIARAEEKAEGVSPRPSFAVGDMRDLPPDEADALLCLYDSINYCLTEEDLRATFASFRRAVREGALCVFDVTTETNSLRYFTKYRCHERWGEFTYHRRSAYLREQRLQINEFLIRRDGSPEVAHERHEQRIYALEELFAVVPADQWCILGAYDEYTLNPAHAYSERVHIVMRAQ